MPDPPPPPGASQGIRGTSVHLILLLGMASLFGSLISNGARSVIGPYILLLGGSAAVVGLVVGFGELVGYALRFAIGIYVDQSHQYWKVAMAGYGLLITIPLLAFIGSWEMAAFLIISERVGKAIRTPARDTILSYATVAVGRGWGFGIHKALGQIGAVAGPLVVAAALAFTGGYATGFLLLALPLAGVAASLLLAQSAVPRPGRLEVRMSGDSKLFANLPGVVPYAAFIFFSMAGFANFPLISFHLKAQSITPDTTIPLFYASAMVVSVVVALLIGRAFDHIGIHALLAIPILSTVTALLAFSLTPGLAIAGSLTWGAGIGLSETVVRASIAESTTLEYRGEVYGILSAVFGAAWFVGSVVMGILYEVSLAYIVTYVVIVEIAAVATYLWIYRARMATWIRKAARGLIP
ncbi:MAG: MFS transporter [Methanomicrobiales archaeon]|nr:MFS transporter [Methanomicrobiales archaeon]